jgi:hypothetical protein
MCATLHDISSRKAIIIIIKRPHKPIIERNALLNNREDIMAKWKNYTMRNFVVILREFKYAVAGTSYLQSSARWEGDSGCSVRDCFARLSRLILRRHPPPRRYPYFWGLCGHIIPRAMLAVAYATDRAFHARQVKGDDPGKKGYPGPPGCRFGVGLTTPHSKKLIVTKVEQRKKLDRFKDDGESW